MKPKRTWIVIANGARARIARSNGPGKALEPAFAYDFAAPRAPTRAIVSDRPGTYPDRGGLGTHQFAPKTDRHEYEKTLLAGDLAEVLDKGAVERAFDRLILVAPPAMLGRLRQAITRRAQSRVTAEIKKDLTHVPWHALRRHLGETLAL
jgi:protein required for attachment to host cells